MPKRGNNQGWRSQALLIMPLILFNGSNHVLMAGNETCGAKLSDPDYGYMLREKSCIDCVEVFRIRCHGQRC